MVADIKTRMGRNYLMNSTKQKGIENSRGDLCRGVGANSLRKKKKNDNSDVIIHVILTQDAISPVLRFSLKYLK